MEGVEKLGKEVAHPYRPPQPEDILTINYTSGTTGDPKGVVLTHGNCVAAVTSSRMSGNMSHKDSSMSYLPLAHIYGRVCDQTALAEGAALGFFHGNVLELVDDLKVLKPSGFISVPRLYNKFAMGIKAQTIEAEGFKGALSRRVIETKKASMKLPPGKANNTHLLYDRLWRGVARRSRFCLADERFAGREERVRTALREQLTSAREGLRSPHRPASGACPTKVPMVWKARRNGLHHCRHLSASVTISRRDGTTYSES